MQLTPINIALTVACLIGIGGCATTGPKPISNVSNRYEFDGFSVMPPQGSGWSIRENSRNDVTFDKELGSDVVVLQGGGSGLAPRSFFTNISILPSEGVAARPFTSEFLKSETERRFKMMQTTRMSLIDYKIDPFVMQGTDCVRYEVQFEEKDHPRFPRGTIIEMTGSGFTCRHPSSPLKAVDGKYSERRLRGASERPIETHKSEAETALRSVIFTPLR